MGPTLGKETTTTKKNPRLSSSRRNWYELVCLAEGLGRAAHQVCPVSVGERDAAPVGTGGGRPG